MYHSSTTHRPIQVPLGPLVKFVTTLLGCTTDDKVSLISSICARKLKWRIAHGTSRCCNPSYGSFSYTRYMGTELRPDFMSCKKVIQWDLCFIHKLTV